jgi:hypothetical protein
MRNLMMLVLLTGLLTACSSAATPIPTVTPLIVPTANPTAFPTTPPAGVAGTDTGELATAQQALNERRFAYAISLLTKAYAGDVENAELRELLAGAYLAWGRDSIAQAGGTLEEQAATFSLAADRLNNGLALLPENAAEYPEARATSQTATSFIAHYRELLTLKQLAETNGDLATRQAAGAALADQLTAIQAAQPDFPGISTLTIDALITAAAAYEATGLQGERAKPLLEQGRTYCAQAVSLGDTDAAPACVTRITARLTAPTPVPTRVQPTPVPPRLYVNLLNRDERPTCLSMQITGIGTNGWIFSIDGLRISGRFDGGGNASVCGLGFNQEVTFTILYPDGNQVPGGSGIPARGGDIFRGVWR